MLLEHPGTSTCDFCDKVGFTVPVADLFERMIETIGRDWSPSGESDQVPFSHEFRDDPQFQPREYETSDLLHRLDEPLGSDGRLRELFCEALQASWIHDDTSAGTRAENLEWSWEDFARTI
jgi:hypothetical protein